MMEFFKGLDYEDLPLLYLLRSGHVSTEIKYGNGQGILGGLGVMKACKQHGMTSKTT